MAPEAVPLSREDTIEELFRALNNKYEDNGCLDEREFGQFAAYRGVPRKNLQAEFVSVCSLYGSDSTKGLWKSGFAKLVSNKLAGQFHCTDEDLADALTAQNDKNREDFCDEAFSLLDSGENGLLQSDELLAFAQLVGAIDEEETEWEVEYERLCWMGGCDPQLGVSKEGFSKLVGEQHFNLSNDELFQFRNKQRGSTRERLVPALFDALDIWADGSLGSAEIKIVAEFSGFHGAGRDWDKHYKNLCASAMVDAEVGLNYEDFEQMTGDDNALGSYLTEKELRVLLKASLVAKRSKLINALFQALDFDDDGALGAEELRLFAVGTGFDGSPSRWKKEFLRICKEFNCNAELGIAEDKFSKFVSDKSDLGCYCSETELGKLLAYLTSKNRVRLVMACFASLDNDHDGHLDMAELVSLAQALEFFERPDSEWKGEYKRICFEASCDCEEGVSQKAFVALVEGELDSGRFFCSDETLKKLLRSAGGSMADYNAEALKNGEATSAVVRGDHVSVVIHDADEDAPDQIPLTQKVGAAGLKTGRAVGRMKSGGGKAKSGARRQAGGGRRAAVPEPDTDGQEPELDTDEQVS